MTDFATREWLLGFLAKNKREIDRDRKNSQANNATKFIAEYARKKPWPRKSGLTTATGGVAMWRP